MRSPGKPTLWTVTVLTPTVDDFYPLQRLDPARAIGPYIQPHAAAVQHSASPPGASKQLTPLRAAGQGGVVGLAVEPNAAGVTSAALAPPQAAGSAPLVVQLPCEAVEQSHQHFEKAGRAVADAGDPAHHAARTQPGPASSVAVTAIPRVVTLGSTVTQQALVAAQPPDIISTERRVLSSQPPIGQPAAEHTMPRAGQTIPVSAPQMQTGVGGVGQGPFEAGERQQLPAQTEPIREQLTAAVAPADRSPAQGDAAPGDATPKAAQDEPPVPAAPATTSAAAAEQSTSELLHFDHVAVRGRNMRVPQKLADVVVAGLPDDEQHTATIRVNPSARSSPSARCMTRL